MTSYAETTEQLTRNEEKVIISVVDSICTLLIKVMTNGPEIIIKTVDTVDWSQFLMSILYVGGNKMFSVQVSGTEWICAVNQVILWPLVKKIFESEGIGRGW